MAVRKLGVLTSGGDCPGLNAVIRAIARHAVGNYGWELWGIAYATQGLLKRQAIALSPHHFDRQSLDPLLCSGGTILGSINRGDTLAHQAEILAGYQELGLDALIGIGGDGSLAILRQLAEAGRWQFIGIPKTIDNDVALTERAIGFDTAIHTVAEALLSLGSTAASHDRIMIAEVMGRQSGHLALQGGIAGGADVILLPEIPYRLLELCHYLQQLRDRWQRRYAVIAIAEGTHHPPEVTQGPGSLGEQLVQAITAQDPTLDARVTVLGHVQRGGNPVASDRLLAAQMGYAAVERIAAGASGEMMAWQGGRVVSVPLEAVCLQSPTLVDPHSLLVDTAAGLGIFLGDRSLTPWRGSACPTH
ncbi:ATP-dependent 6-phosphofructokinase [Synechococcus elongatus]|uniref:ATP-dependent 6-phosphofructokinase n=1 Tax=Synechococcus elongatus TaxID=32046 RepID=UPI000F7DDCDC|nr:ATP-dependent 6-phosphofructokinase [Synechococcus elongatus]